MQIVLQIDNPITKYMFLPDFHRVLYNRTHIFKKYIEHAGNLRDLFPIFGHNKIDIQRCLSVAFLQFNESELLTYTEHCLFWMSECENFYFYQALIIST